MSYYQLYLYSINLVSLSPYLRVQIVVNWYTECIVGDMVLLLHYSLARESHTNELTPLMKWNSSPFSLRPFSTFSLSRRSISRIVSFSLEHLIHKKRKLVGVQPVKF